MIDLLVDLHQYALIDDLQKNGLPGVNVNSEYYNKLEKLARDEYEEGKETHI